MSRKIIISLGFTLSALLWTCEAAHGRGGGGGGGGGHGGGGHGGGGHGGHPGGGWNGHGHYGYGYRGYGYGYGPGIFIGVGLGGCYYDYGYPGPYLAYPPVLTVAPAPVAVPVPVPTPSLKPIEPGDPPDVPSQQKQQKPEKLPDPVPADESVSRIQVTLPAGATLSVNGTVTRKTGAVRDFHSPELEPGKAYIYTFKARWKEDGRMVEQTRTIQVRANDKKKLTFTSPIMEAGLPKGEANRSSVSK
jgi:uncharacterized protein (TIGR03000 family)